MSRRDTYLQMTRRPGKFELEAAYVPYFWEQYLDGCADADDGDILTFTVIPEDVAIFPELKDRRTVCLRERDDGFVVEIG